MQLVPEQIARWLLERLVTLETDGLGRSDSREDLRRHFEVDAAHIAFATLSTLAREGRIERSTTDRAVKSLGIDTEKINLVRT